MAGQREDGFPMARCVSWGCITAGVLQSMNNEFLAPGLQTACAHFQVSWNLSCEVRECEISHCNTRTNDYDMSSLEIQMIWLIIDSCKWLSMKLRTCPTRTEGMVDFRSVIMNFDFGLVLEHVWCSRYQFCNHPLTECRFENQAMQEIPQSHSVMRKWSMQWSCWMVSERLQVFMLIRCIIVWNFPAGLTSGSHCILGLRSFISFLKRSILQDFSNILGL